MRNKIIAFVKDDKDTAYATLSLMKWMYKKGDISKVQYKEMLRLCSPFLDTSGLMPEVIFCLQRTPFCSKI